MLHLNKELLKANPKVMENFIKFYKEFDGFPKPDINNFFDTHFSYQLPIWLEFFNSHNVSIACVYGAGFACINKNNNINSAYSNIADKNGDIIVADDKTIISPIHMFETVISKLIIKINNPF